MEAFKTLLLGTPPTRTYTASATGLLTSANNLSDVADAATARTNLNVAAKVGSSTDNAIVRFDGTGGQQQNSGCTIDDSGNLSAGGVSGSIGQATTSNRYLDVGSTTDGQTVGYNLGVFDGANNYRASFFLDDATGISGINVNRSSGTPQVQLQLAGVPRFIGTTTGSAVFGTTTNDNAATGYVGEYVSSTVAIGSAVSLTNTTPANMTSISLTAGDWDVEVNGNYNLSGASGVTLFAGVNTTSATFGDNSTYSLKYTPMTTATAVDGLVSNVVRVSLSGSATVYAVVRADFSAGTVGAFGSMRARRVR